MLLLVDTQEVGLKYIYCCINLISFFFFLFFFFFLMTDVSVWVSAFGTTTCSWCICHLAIKLYCIVLHCIVLYNRENTAAGAAISWLEVSVCDVMN